MSANSKRPYNIHVLNSTGHPIWAGRKTRSFGTVEAARAAAVNLAATILEVSPKAVAIEVREGPHGPVVERVEVEAL